jgi:hypothetical protein
MRKKTTKHDDVANGIIAKLRRVDDLIIYLRSSVDAGDWHSVRDAASDIEVQLERVETARTQWRLLTGKEWTAR